MQLSRFGDSHGCLALTEPWLAPKRLNFRCLRFKCHEFTIESTDERAGYFITWTVYGMFLLRDAR